MSRTIAAEAMADATRSRGDSVKSRTVSASSLENPGKIWPETANDLCLFLVRAAWL
jgi:hypothetical protein